MRPGETIRVGGAPLGGTDGPDALAALSHLAPITLDELEQTAAALSRIDRKYLVPAAVVDDLLRRWDGRATVLEIDGRRTFAYHSDYFDTDDFSLHRHAATKRRRRYKVRTRTYDSGLVMLEVKTKDGRGRTIKHRTVHHGSPLELGDDARSFVTTVTGDASLPGRLRPSLATDYLRSTLVIADAASRTTIDRALQCTTPDGRGVATDAFVIETKSAYATGEVDRWLWSQGRRPDRVSKYATALAVIDPDLPSNPWRADVRAHFRPVGAGA